MSKFFHEIPHAKELFETLAAEMKLLPSIVEKDYWVMHCLWGLREQGFHFELKGGTSLSKGWKCIQRFSEDIDIRFESPASLNTKSDKSAHVKARFRFYDELASKIKIAGISVERNRSFDDEKARNGGIDLRYDSLFETVPLLRQAVLLEAGFDKTVPNEPKDITSWIWEKSKEAGLDIADNRAIGIKCFNPEYTFVDKVQTISRKFRLHRDRNDPQKDAPRIFLRHYYDLYNLLGLERVLKFLGTPDYNEYKREKLRGKDEEEFNLRDAFNIPDAIVLISFAKEYEAVKDLLFPPAPSLDDIIGRIRKHCTDF